MSGKPAYFAKWLRHRVVFPALALLPAALGYRIASRIGRRDALRHPARAAVMHGLLTIHPHLANEPQHLEALLDHYFRMMAKDMLDCFRMPAFTPRNTHELIRVAGIDKLAAAKAAGKGVILIISHYSRFFMLGPGLKFAGQEFGMFTTVVDERHPHYDPVDRWYIATKLHNTQLFSRGSWITTGDDRRKIYRALEAGEVILIALDGTETSSPTRYDFPFLGGILSLPEGIVRIAARTGAKMVYAATVEEGDGVAINIHPLPDDPVAGLGEAVRILERDVIAYPWQWWQWAAHGALWRPAPAN
ncbi:MAG: hypothetical protein KGZ83_01965 [Sulfuricella sp.]|nr:hypothetical protein [Sulfuricella sp.]